MASELRLAVRCRGSSRPARARRPPSGTASGGGGGAAVRPGAPGGGSDRFVPLGPYAAYGFAAAAAGGGKEPLA
ncbi:hypothetical protein R5R35_000078 [Gryllus longicercus]